MSPDDFARFFEEVNGHKPFPWQRRLLHHILEKQGNWPRILDLPTGSGKTAAIDIAVFHLALEADRAKARQAPVRIAFVVDRRLVVDDAFARARRLEGALRQPTGPVTTRVAERLKRLAGDGPPLIVRRLRGGIPREDDWARTPSQPTVLCSTVDQIGSRLLFRGYGVSDSMKPVHAGLFGSDCLLLLDEAHLAEPFRQALGWVEAYRSGKWRESDTVAPWCVALLTATPGAGNENTFPLDDDDRSHPVLKRRLSVSKPARLICPTNSRTGREVGARVKGEADGHGATDVVLRTTAMVGEVKRALEHFKRAANGALAPAVAVVVNRVARARAVFEGLKEELKEEIHSGVVSQPILMIGPARPIDRDDLAGALEPIRTRLWREGESRVLDRSIIVVATQCIEAGVDVDFDGLISEAAPLDALRQRFGRLNRSGRDLAPYAAIVGLRADVAARQDDPVYGMAIQAAWKQLEEASKANGGHGVDFGVNAFVLRMEADALAPRADAPVLLPAHVDLLSHTSPIPAPDPDVALYLHGPNRQPDAITIVWRADIDPSKQEDEEVRRLLTLVPPRSPEAIELPIWAVRRWLVRRGETADQLADIAGAEPEDDESGILVRAAKKLFRWRGDDDLSRWISPAELQPGDTVVAPSDYGGVDQFGWSPESQEAVRDIAQEATRLFAGRRSAVRVAPGLVGESVSDDALAHALARAASGRWHDVRTALSELPLPEPIRNELEALSNARAGRVIAYTDAYGVDDLDRARGVVFVAPLGIKGGGEDEDGRPNATEDDAAGSIPGFRLTLAEHHQDVGDKAQAFGRAAGLPEARVADLRLAGLLHDGGKADPRFQAWLYYGDPLGPEPDQILAKSGRTLPRAARQVSGLPDNWRHEALSVRLARADSRLAEANDPDLVLWLIGTHHGYGRPLFPHHDPTERASDVGPQSLAFDWQGLDWASLFVQLKARYGVWELARMEAILRLADHRASEARASGVGSR